MIRTLNELFQNEGPLPGAIWAKWDGVITIADLYKSAFEVEDGEEAELYLVQLLLWRARSAVFPILRQQWERLLATERLEMAWFALAVDASNVDCCKRGLPPTLAKIKRLYGAELPLALGIGERRLDPKAQAVKDRAAAKGNPITDFEARLQIRKVQRMKRDDAKRDHPELFSGE